MLTLEQFLALEETDRVKPTVKLLLHILPETQIKMNFYSYHQDAPDNKIIRVSPSVKVSYLLYFISEDEFFSLGYFWMYSKQGNFLLTIVMSSSLAS